MKKFSEGFYEVYWHVYSLRTSLIRGFVAQHARLKSKGCSHLGLTDKCLFTTEVVRLHH
jgi:hypothetical protein